MKAVLVLAGEVAGTALLRRHLDTADLVIAADGGAARLQALGRLPDVLVGDLDSLAADALAALQAADVELVAHPNPEQQTDGMVGLLLARQRGADEIVLAGVQSADRLDHGFANLLYLSARELHDVRITVVSDWSEGVLLRGSGAPSVRFRGAPGDYVSLVPISDEVRGVDTIGLRYPLRAATLARGASSALSNELVGEEGGFDIGEGAAFAFHHFRQGQLP